MRKQSEIDTRNILTTTQGHESNGCPLPRTTEAKQCYHCQGLGHVQGKNPEEDTLQESSLTFLQPTAQLSVLAVPVPVADATLAV
jgi:hypothetical protein